ncbi:MAG: hypothetical protein PHN33_02710 [Candidatus Peribacteraceae bacterium]|nr:hypothetical protein [Candidatus Peribacteraceae bacterium]
MTKDNDYFLMTGKVPEDYRFKPVMGNVLSDNAVQVSGMTFKYRDIGRQGQKLVDMVEIYKEIAARKSNSTTLNNKNKKKMI